MPRQRIFVLSDSGVPRTFVEDCSSVEIRGNLSHLHCKIVEHVCE